MTAEEMFLKKDYEKEPDGFCSTSYIFENEYVTNVILFDKENKIIEFNSYLKLTHTDRGFKDIDLDLLKAIIKQTEEFGW